MTKAEQTQAILEAQAKFYSWEPRGNPHQQFRCHDQPSTPIMNETQCQARATRPEIYNGICSNKCPRWRYYRKLVKKVNQDDGLVRRAYR